MPARKKRRGGAVPAPVEDDDEPETPLEQMGRELDERLRAAGIEVTDEPPSKEPGGLKVTVVPRRRPDAPKPGT